MLRALIPALFLALPLPAAAQMSAEAFDAYTRGKTLFYGMDGEAYGVERYLPGRRVIWSFLDGDCREGHWYEQAGRICFVYEDHPEPQCWTFTETPGGLTARFQGDPAEIELYEAEETGREMICLGPEVGV
ncbi:MAG TPA: hypothetical protein DEA05_14855 [Rhodobacteraceae bacterium]|jgi:hypothetical protein|nr:hypothetical protein [Paracoccaceae bacterium]